jgi:Activator of Hsp90 ATPase homolog 1-like protein
MADILHCFPVRARAQRIFESMTSPMGLDTWWTQRSKGTPALGETYELWFGPEYDWRGTVTRCEPGRVFEWTMTQAMDDWLGTRVGFELFEREGVTTVEFYHAGWKEASSHYRVSNCCWAMYLRVLRRNVEFGEVVPYEERLNS